MDGDVAARPAHAVGAGPLDRRHAQFLGPAGTARPGGRRRPPVGPLGFVQTTDDFSADQPWNGWPRAVAERLLDGPLDPTARATLSAATERFHDARPCPAPDPDRLLADPRLTTYRPLLGWCRLATEALAGGAVLFNLERLFETHLAALIAGARGGRSVTSQRPIPVRAVGGGVTLELRPDLTVLDAHGQAVSVWDAKWKTLTASGPHPDDMHQVLGYAAALGVRTAGLIYPGRRFRACLYETPSGVSVTVATCRLTGNDVLVRRSADRLRRLVARP